MSETSLTEQAGVELIDILFVIWKWKKLILSGILFFLILAAIIIIYSPKTYKIEMMFQPGIINSRTNSEYSSRVSSLAGRISSGAYESRILKSLEEAGFKEIPYFIELNVRIPKDSNLIQIIYETADGDLGKHILSALYKMLAEEDDEEVSNAIADLKSKIQFKTTDLEANKADVQIVSMGISNIDKRSQVLNDSIKEMKNEILDIRKQMNSLIEEKADKKDLTDQNKQVAFSILFFSNAIQLKYQAISDLRMEIDKTLLLKEDKIKELNELKRLGEELREGILSLSTVTLRIKKMEALVKPTKSVFPTKPKKRLIVILAFISGILIMTFLAFVLEYLMKNKDSFAKVSIKED